MTTLRLIFASLLLLASTPFTHPTSAGLVTSFVQYFQNFVLNPNRFIPDTKSFAPEYDFVVVGAGSAGSVIANRLTENPRWTVLLIEAGKDETFITDIPLMASYVVTSDYSWHYYSERDDRFCRGMTNGVCSIPKGKALGGSSTINFMVYSRGSAGDYDRWRDLGNPGWGYADVLPYFIKSENASIAGLEHSWERGHDGYLNVQHARWRSPLAKTFLEAGRDAGLDHVDVSARTRPGISLVQATMKNGERCSTSRAFLRPVRDRPNLFIAQQARVTRVLIDAETRSAYGVAFVKGATTHVVRARKEVVLSAGAINSPQLLMVSGVGPREHLEALGIPVLQDLRVGFNLQDHVSMTGLTFVLNDSVSVAEHRLLLDPRPPLQYVTERRGLLTLPGGSEGMAFVQTRFATERDEPDIELVFGPGAPVGKFAEAALRTFLGVTRAVTDQVFSGVRGRDAFSLVPILMRPRSRGRLMLRSADAQDAPRIFLNYFDDERDLHVLVEGVKQAVAMGESRAFQKYSSRLHGALFPGCEHLPFRSDAYWRCCVRLITISLQHQSGTCKMGPASDADAVVDAELRVLGVDGLRVADASVMPELPSAHTNSVAVMIGEKAADMIKAAWMRLLEA